MTCPPEPTDHALQAGAALPLAPGRVTLRQNSADTVRSLLKLQVQNTQKGLGGQQRGVTGPGAVCARQVFSVLTLSSVSGPGGPEPLDRALAGVPAGRLSGLEVELALLLQPGQTSNRTPCASGSALE